MFVEQARAQGDEAEAQRLAAEAAAPQGLIRIPDLSRALFGACSGCAMTWSSA
jgi:hypothetical protein